jgi:hypothetical protein
MRRTLLIALALEAAALGGCATSLDTNTNTLSGSGSASPSTSSAPPPGNVFYPSPGPQYHGSMGP